MMFPVLPILSLVGSPFAQEPPSATFSDGLRLSSADGALELELGGLLQTNFYAYPGGTPGRASEAELRRLRLEFAGRFDRIWRFSLEPSFSEDAVELEEAWIGAELPGGALVMLGRMKEPFGMEEMTPRKRQDFPEYSLLNRWSPAEDHGITLHGEAADGRLWYGVAAYNGTGGEETNDDKDVAVRLAWRPLGAPAPDGSRSFLQLAANATWGEADEDVSGSGLFQDGRRAFASFVPGARLDGLRTRAGADLTWLSGPHAWMAEWIRVAEDSSGPLGAGEAVTRGWMLSASRVLTGEARGWKGIDPLRPLGGGGAGALQLATRWSELRFDEAWIGLGMLAPASFPGTVRSLDVGVNWQATRAASWKLHLIRVMYGEDVAAGGEVVDGETILLLQFQIAF